MESVVTLQDLARREAKKERAERQKRVKVLTTEGLRMKQPPAKKAHGGRVRKNYFSPF